ncbi:hypothetical protein C8Q76DRAFT_576394, partial [Earliella scabrosa]
LTEPFDSAKFMVRPPPDFFSIPWPVLVSPAELTLEVINWQEVEKFFEEAKKRLPPNDYKTFVSQAQRRFHPDRWRSR